jgi:hypothetical protein
LAGFVVFISSRQLLLSVPKQPWETSSYMDDLQISSSY